MIAEVFLGAAFGMLGGAGLVWATISLIAFASGVAVKPSGLVTAMTCAASFCGVGGALWMMWENAP